MGERRPVHVQRLTVREIRMPLRAPFRTATGTVDTRRLLLVTVDDGAGNVGWAECVAGAVPGYGAETVDSAWQAITGRLARPLFDGPLSGPAEAAPRLAAAAPGMPMAYAALEMACWDLAARSQNRSLASLLGGTRPTVPAGISLGLGATPEETAEAAAVAVAEGYRRVKLKIEPGADLVTVRMVRDRVGFDVMLTVDGNGAYTRDDFDRLSALDDLGLRMIEQPLPAGDLEGHADLQRRLSTPICLDESVTSAADLERVIALQAGRILNLKPGRVGGLAAALTMIDLAVEGGIDLWVGGMLETGVGRAHNVALASLPAFDLPGDLSPSGRYWDRDIVHPPWVMEGGALAVPLTGPGLGVSIDAEHVGNVTARMQEVRAGP